MQHCAKRRTHAGRRRAPGYAERFQANPAAPQRCCARCRRSRPDGGLPWQASDKPIDRVDGRLKVTGRAQYAAEFAVPDVVHAVLVQSTIGAGAITGFDLDSGAGDAGRARDHHAGQCAETADSRRRAADRPRAAAAGSATSSTTASMSRWWWPTRLEQARRRGAAVRVHYRRDEPVTSMDAVLGQAYAPKNFRNGERPPDSQPRRSRRGFRRCGSEGRCHLHHADRASQSDGAARDDRALGRRPADGMDGDAGHFRRAADAGGAVRHRSKQCACDLSLCRRRLRLQGQYLAAGDARGDGGAKLSGGR